MARASASDTDKQRSLARVLRQGALIGVLLLLAACAGSPRREATFKPSHSELADEPARAPENSIGTANDVLFRAMALVGTPYHWGGNTPAGGFDCSGLVDYIYRNAANILLPHSSRDMASFNGLKVRSMDERMSGDLVFFGSGSDISHVGVYVGKGRFVHAPNSGGTVRLDSIDGAWWREHFVYGKRVLD